jgi:altronate dehydratase
VTIEFEEFRNPAKPDMAERFGETSVAQVFQSIKHRARRGFYMMSALGRNERRVALAVSLGNTIQCF